ncbi:MAG: magnesium chelatase [Thermoflexus sp.]|uniref:YifB family Mg chelatase-like AAA ATPase n=1 Tax=Thermoflexus sp. TaxID=1969742 RepID=UPI00331E132D
MLARLFSCALIGLDGEPVTVEVDVSRGPPGFTIVGLPDAAVQEARERVRSAIRYAGFSFPLARIVVNLAPADLRKEGPAYDLPIALGVLLASEQLPRHALEEAMVVGELGLDGTVRHVPGALVMAARARELGFRRMFVPAADAAEAALVPDLLIYPVPTLQDLLAHLLEQRPLSPQPPTPLDHWADPAPAVDFADIKGQEHAKRALEVAAAGNHNVLMVGPPGTGKTLLARALPGILPRLSLEEALEVTRIYSVADLLSPEFPLIRQRPFRAPHHTISHAGLVGGGRFPRPGEISLAHRGVLFLDELPEFDLRALEVLRQPLEDKRVVISRAAGTLEFPAAFQLVAAMNPCPCGYYGDPLKPCTCSPSMVARYQKRLSGPLLDRIDIQIEVPRVEYEKLTDDRRGEPSAAIRERVEQARARQRERFHGTGITCNAEMGPGHIRAYCRLEPEVQSLLKAAMHQLHLSARAYHRILKVARTIADLEGADTLGARHLAEALQYRPRWPLVG